MYEDLKKHISDKVKDIERLYSDTINTIDITIIGKFYSYYVYFTSDSEHHNVRYVGVITISEFNKILRQKKLEKIESL